MLTADKIAPAHRERRAYVYVRQSTPKQVRRNTAGQENQYALVERALALGWARERIVVVDDDQGQSGRDDARAGFQDLVAAVSLGQVGLILAYEASRLARSNAAWYTLLDLATLRGVLLADATGLYDPRDYNDRLLLGLRGMLSEAELHLLRLRMDAGRMRQVEQGRFIQHLPTGLVRLPDGRVAKDPDPQVCHAIELVLARFAELGTCSKVVDRFRDDGLLLPRRQVSGLHAGQLLWKRPSEAAIYAILCNPAYAGAFVYGRRPAHPDRRPGQDRRQRRKAIDDWTAVHRDAYPAYIDWETFVANQQRLADNASDFNRRMRGALRPGTALLAGLAVCGRCGRQMRTLYRPQPRYVCKALSGDYGAPQCLNVDGLSLEAAVVAAFFEALAPAELDLLDAVLAGRRGDQERVARQHAEQVARAAYEARLAEQQFLAADPDNRLVAAELERRWEQALRALAAAREAAEPAATAAPPPALDPALRAQLRDVGPRMPELWASGRLTAEHKKGLLRSLIRRIILSRPVADRVEVKVVWVSGAISPLTVCPPIWRATDLSDYARLCARVRDLGAAGYQDDEIARRLTAEGFHGPRGRTVPVGLVGDLRRQPGVRSLTAAGHHQARVDGQWTVLGLARQLGVKRDWLYRRRAAGRLASTRHPMTHQHLIADDPALLAGLAAEVATVRWPRGRPMPGGPDEHA